MPRIHTGRSRAACLRVFLLLSLASWPHATPSPLPAADAPASVGEAILHLNNGGSLTGELVPVGEVGRIRWRSSSFAEPLVFETGFVGNIQFPVPATLPIPDAE